MAHSSVVIKEWETLNNYLSEEESTVTLNGKDLSLGALVVVSGQLLNRDVVPKIPLRGSISASGDLSPLSYVAGTIQGKSTIGVRYGSERGIYSEMTAGKALAEAKILPVTLTAKEGLAIVNGNAVSAGVAALALWETHNLAIMSQLLTAMAVEALSGTDENFDPAFGRVRPHPGQIDCLNNIHRFLEGSKLIHHNDGDNDALRQDRYSIRTASQWLGPVLEDFLLAHQQMHIEMNSVTDNPISTPTVIEFCTVGISRPRLLHQRLKRYGSLSKQLDACYSSNARK
ncbi:MAG: hypothetical protein Q9205_005621 [Flavoplaca limonia]